MALDAIRELLAGWLGTATPAQQDVERRRSTAARVKAETDAGAGRILTDPEYRALVAERIRAMATPTPMPTATQTPVTANYRQDPRDEGITQETMEAIRRRQQRLDEDLQDLSF